MIGREGGREERIRESVLECFRVYYCSNIAGSGCSIGLRYRLNLCLKSLRSPRDSCCFLFPKTISIDLLVFMVSVL